jgi:hypothetical protein
MLLHRQTDASFLRQFGQKEGSGACEGLFFARIAAKKAFQGQKATAKKIETKTIFAVRFLCANELICQPVERYRYAFV